MVSLNELSPLLQRVIDTFSSFANVEVAIFDKNCHIVVSTQKYIKHKGKSVHTPSVLEALSNASTVITNPGNMPSCIGCRFNGHCPSTIELLNSIKINDNPEGVISITSFTKGGQRKLTKNMNDYIGILREISELIGSIISHSQDISTGDFYLDKTFQSIMDMSSDSFIAVDKEGIIKYINLSAHKAFCSSLSLDKSIFDALFHEEMEVISLQDRITNKVIKNQNFNGIISGFPIIKNNQFLGALLKINRINSIKPCSKINSIQYSTDYIDNIKGRSNSVLQLKSQIRKFSNSSSTVLITGETGTGKEMFAKAIHYSSSRSNFPFISINCASIPENLFESELFGYEEGAFTGARKGGKPGRFELAQGGTLLLDEIGEMPLYMQAKLLRVLQEKAIERVGGTEKINIDIRIIAATNQNLKELIENKKFRSDLYYRLNVIPLHIPPLRMRVDDINDLAVYFLQKYNQQLNKQIKGFSHDAMNLLINCSWPGNIRELENVIEYAVNMETKKAIQISSFPEGYHKNTSYKEAYKYKDKIKSVEDEAIRLALDKYGWDVKGKSIAAKELGMGLRTLYRKLKMMETVDSDIE